MLLILNLPGGCKYKMYNLSCCKFLYLLPPAKFNIYNMTHGSTEYPCNAVCLEFCPKQKNINQNSHTGNLLIRKLKRLNVKFHIFVMTKKVEIIDLEMSYLVIKTPISVYPSTCTL